MKKTFPSAPAGSPVSASPKEFRVLKKCLRELQALYAEANAILNDLMISPSADIVRCLCTRFRVLQDYFALRYREARKLAIFVLGSVEAALSFPSFQLA
jgi:hypothetical protein